MKTLKTLALLGLMAAGSSVMATQITGTLNFSTLYDINVDTPADLSAVSSVDFTGPAFTTSGTLGFSAVPSFTAATFTDFSVGTSVPSLWTLALPGWSFDLDTSANVSNDPNFLNIQGTGTIHSPLFSDTPGTFSLTAPRSGDQLTFSFAASTTAVPDGGATAMLLGIGLIGVGALRRKVA